LRRRAERPAGKGVRLNLRYRPPYDWGVMFAALAARGDRVEGRVWSRDLDPAGPGFVTATPGRPGLLAVCVDVDDLKALPGVLARVRRVFDLSADPEAIARDLSADPHLRPLVEARPGLRLPGDWIDPGDDAPSDRLADPGLAAQAERWPPWRAYGALYLQINGLLPVREANGEVARRAFAA
jgi:AraC family transcriptional regulator of adaptative response / DNA-3-methyladenine glycosylase II